MASRGIKGEGYARYPHPFPALRSGLRLPVPPLTPLPAPNGVSSGAVKRMTGQGVGAARSPQGEDTAP